MTSAPKVGIVGYGYAGKTFHAPLIAGVPGLQWVGVSSSDAARVHAPTGPASTCTTHPRHRSPDPTTT